MPFLLNPNLKSDMWSKHKSFLAGSTGVGDKLKARCGDRRPDRRHGRGGTQET